MRDLGHSDFCSRSGSLLSAASLVMPPKIATALRALYKILSTPGCYKSCYIDDCGWKQQHPGTRKCDNGGSRQINPKAAIEKKPEVVDSKVERRKELSSGVIGEG